MSYPDDQERTSPIDHDPIDGHFGIEIAFSLGPGKTMMKIKEQSEGEHPDVPAMLDLLFARARDHVLVVLDIDSERLTPVGQPVPVNVVELASAIDDEFLRLGFEPLKNLRKPERYQYARHVASAVLELFRFRPQR